MPLKVVSQADASNEQVYGSSHQWYNIGTNGGVVVAVVAFVAFVAIVDNDHALMLGG